MQETLWIILAAILFAGIEVLKPLVIMPLISALGFDPATDKQIKAGMILTAALIVALVGVVGMQYNPVGDMLESDPPAYLTYIASALSLMTPAMFTHEGKKVVGRMFNGGNISDLVDAGLDVYAYYTSDEIETVKELPVDDQRGAVGEKEAKPQG